ncbi:bifunctional ADP-dependent NAD(P)H-hydrate dehydratase/NAD(P)H-hydrate epimerase [Cytophaga aurantiaca]|uniref:bifunctional ADP-dependent NAD(P)H-hydrate dehydratase/NAD(P)H-hydrate epimerase n=1 Tax=Cytophaga aurantiaca TaxID=29530 RepID=UPI000364DBA4|nr:bifunctional ADP-dependent NAD(P)H-hydrate dehydratase/NAD(P)H-hydrate epimerase [Cytophaga aurantiaca]
MKILTAAQIHELDLYTQEVEGITSLELMERAANAFVAWFTKHTSFQKEVWVFCGRGNNGGDGLAIARLLINRGYKVKSFILKTGAPTPDCAANLDRLTQLGAVASIVQAEDIPNIPKHVLIVDALLGSGLNREVTGIYATVIDRINASDAVVYAVDVPSGLYSDYPAKHSSIITADHTITFQAPKLMLFLADHEAYTGSWHVVDISMKLEGTADLLSEYYYTDAAVVHSMIRKRPVFSHKGTFGKVLLIAGSKGMMGAATLAARAILRSGAGLLCVHIPSSGVDIVQTLIPEAILSIDPNTEVVTELPETEEFSAVGIGVGLGEHPYTADVLEELLVSSIHPLVIDASALNILAIHPHWTTHIPPNSILTPHPKELERLAGIKLQNSWERLHKAIELAKKMQVIIVLKGAYTAVVMPTGAVHFNSTGNSGMATAGSGDVLTGIITSLLAQGYTPEEAAKIGVFAHGYAGDAAARIHSKPGMIASDIIDHLSAFFLEFE